MFSGSESEYTVKGTVYQYRTSILAEVSRPQYVRKSIPFSKDTQYPVQSIIVHSRYQHRPY